MSDFVILSDSACDLTPDFFNTIKVGFVPLTFRFDDEEKTYGNFDIPTKEFYDRMRNGRVAKTAAINISEFKEFFAPYLKEGKDILYLSFSSGLSTTYNSAKLAAEELAEEFPDRKIEVVDTLCASAGQGLLVSLVAKERDEGKGFEQLCEFARETLPCLAHWFTVDDLQYLKRGGRVSPSVAFVGGLLGIKPVLHMDDQGHLMKMSVARGIKASLDALADKYISTAKQGSPAWISHGDCIDDANLLADMLKEKCGVEVSHITDIGPVIGAHSGPGTIAFFFVAKER